MRHARREGTSPRGTGHRRAVRAVLSALGVAWSALRGAPARMARMWRRQTEISELLAERQRPWLQEGSLRWEGRGRRARLVGSHLPVPGLPAAGHPSP